MTGVNDSRASENRWTEGRPIGVDVFCGAGGMSLGFEQAGFDVLAAVDSDPIHLAVHERNLPHAHPLCADVSAVEPTTIHSAIRKGWALNGRPGEWDGTIDCIFGGPSCQGFSDMGQRNANDHRNDLIFAFARLVEELKPRSFVMENVPGLLFPGVRNKLVTLNQRLRTAGYTLQSDPPHCLDAADHGVPQRRRRVFLIGVLPALPVPAQPAKQPSPNVAEALDDLPNVDDFPDLLTTTRLQLLPDQKVTLEAEASKYVHSLRERYGLEYAREWDRSVLAGCQRTRHSLGVSTRFAALAPGAEDEISRTSRLDPTGLAKTMRAGTGRDHGSFTAPRPIHHKHARVVTVREAARLHSFPDWFEFHVTKWHALREIGNSVPPRLAEAVARTVVASLGYLPTMPNDAVALGPDNLLRLSLRQAADNYGLDKDLLPSDVRRRQSPAK